MNLEDSTNSVKYFILKNSIYISFNIKKENMLFRLSEDFPVEISSQQLANEAEYQKEDVIA
jgi:hypothetical protein